MKKVRAAGKSRSLRWAASAAALGLFAFVGSYGADPALGATITGIGSLHPIIVYSNTPRNTEEGFPNGTRPTIGSAENSIAMGFGSNIDTGYNNIAIGVNATISRGVQYTTANAIALGASSLVTAGGDMAVGWAAQALSDNAVAIGTMATASGKNSFALGSSSQAMGEMSFASGFGSKASGTSSFASGYYAQANGNSSVAVGGLSVAGQQYGTDFSTAIGYNAQALAMGSVAIGYNSMVSASVNNSLAIGSGTVLSTPVADGQYEAFTHQKLNDTTNGMLAIANEGTPRRIIGVAGGVNATDAVNVRQLQYVNNNLAKSIGGALYTGYASDNTTYQAPDFVIGAATYHTVKEAIEAAQNRYFSVSSTNKTDGSNYNNNGASGVDSVAIGPSAQTKNADNALAIGSGASVTVSGGVALGSGSVASDASGVGSAAYLGSAANVAATAKGTAGVLSVGSSAATRQIVNVAAGSRDTDAVNVAQLKAAGVNVAGGSNVVSVSPSSDPKTGATTYTVNVDLSNYAQTNGSNITNPATWAGKLGTGTINGTTDGGLVTGTTVKGALAPYAKTAALPKVAVTGAPLMMKTDTDAAGSTTYTVGIDLSNYAQTNGNNITDPTAWAGKLGSGTIGGTTDGNLVTGTTVKNYVDGRRTQVSSADSRVVVTDEPIGTGGTMYKVALKTDQFKIKYSGDGDTTGENALDDRTAFVGTPNQISTVAENGKVTFKLDDVVTIGGSGGHPVTVNGTEGNIIGLTNTGWNTDNPVIVSGRAATEDQLSAVNEKVKQAAVAASGKIAFSGTTGKADVGLGEGLTITGDLAANADASSDNLRASVTGSTLKIEMSTAPTFKSVNAETLHADNKVTVGSAGAPTTTITPAGVDTNKLTVGTVTIDKTTNKITGLPADAGTGESEAVSGKYLKDQLKTVSDTVAASSNLSYAGDSGNGKVNLSTGTLSVKGDDKNIATVADAAGNVTVSLKDKITLGAAGTGIVLDGGHASAEFGPSIKINESGNGRISGLHPAIENGQAVTYEQLERVAASFGAKSTITADGKFVRPTYLVSATTSASRVYHSVGEALTAIDRGTVGSLVAVEKDSGDGPRLVYLENVGPAEDKTGFFRRTDLVDKNSGKLLQPKEITANPLSLDKISYALANPATGMTSTPVKIQNVAAGTLEDDAVNVSQLKKLGLDPSATAVKPVVTYDDDQKKTVTLGDTNSNPYNEATHLGGVKITNVAEGVNPGDAVNMHQLKVVSDKVDAGWNLQDGATSPVKKNIASGNVVAVTGDKNISTALSGDGETKTLNISLSDSPKFGNVTINDAGSGRITGVKAGANDTDAVNVSQIKSLAQVLNVTVDPATGVVSSEPKYQVGGHEYNTVNDAINAVTSTGTNLALNGVQKGDLLHGNTLDIGKVDGKNLEVSYSETDDVKTYQFRVVDAPTFNGKVTAQGFDAGNQKIVNVAKGTEATDAVNYEQLQSVLNSVTSSVTTRIDINAPVNYVAKHATTTPGQPDEEQVRIVEVTENGATVKKAYFLSDLDDTGHPKPAAQDIPFNDVYTSVIGLDTTTHAPSIDKNVRLSNVGKGLVDDDAANVSQLKKFVQALGGGMTFDEQTGDISDLTYHVPGRVFNNVGSMAIAAKTGSIGPIVYTLNDGERLVYLKDPKGNNSGDGAGFYKLSDVNEDGVSLKNVGAAPVESTNIKLSLVNPSNVKDSAIGSLVVLGNVAPGSADTDAVNVSQLKKLGLDPNAAAPAVTYDNDQKKTVTLGDTVHNKYDPTNNPTGGVTITNVAEGVNPGDAVNMHQLKVVSDKVDAGWNLQDGAAASAAKKIASGDTVKVVGDKNISTALSGGGETKTLQITLSDSPVFGLVKINDGGRISGLLPGKADTEAATVYQIKKILTSLGGGMTLDENNGDIKLPQYELPGGTYNNIGSIAIAAKTGTMGTTVFTDADGKRIVWLRDPALNHTNTYNKAGYYRLEDVAENGISLKDTITDPDAHLVPTGQIRLSLTGPTDINRVLLDEDVVLGHVAAGTKDNDAVNVSQLKDVKKSIDKAKTDGLTFNGNKASYGAAGSSTTGAVALGSTVNVVASDPKNNATYSTDNLTVVAGKDASGAPVLTIKMADSPTFKALTAETVTAGGTSISNSGLSVGGKTYVSPIGLNANGNPIKNVGDAAEDGDAVNKKQLDALGGSTITVKAFDKADGDKGSYSFALSSNGQVGLKALDDNLVLSADKATNTLGLKLAETVTVGTAKPVTINGTDGSVKVGTTVLDGSQITGLTNTTWNGSPTSGRAATEDQLKAVADAASTASGELKDSGLTFTGNDSSTTRVVKLGNTLAVTADGTTGGTYTSANLKVTATEANGTNPAGLKISMTNSPVFTTVTAGNTSISDAGLTVGGKPYVTPTGLNANSKKITNVAEGTEEGDAVNFKQFDELANKKIAFMALDQNGKPIGEKYEFALKDGGTIKLLSDENFAVTADATHQALGVKLRDTVKIGAANPVTVNGAEGFVTGLTNTAWNGTATTGRAATEDQLKAVAVAASGELKDSGLTFIGNTGTTNLVKLGSTLAIKAGDPAGGATYKTDNLTVEAGKDASDAPVLTIKMADSPIFTTVTTGGTSISDGGLSVGGNTYVGPDGLNANSKKITKVAEGTEKGDAVNFEQFNKLRGAEVTVAAMDKSGNATGGQYSFALKDGGGIGLKGDDNIVVTADAAKQALGLKLNDKVTVGAAAPVMIDGTNGTVTGLANKDLKAPTFATMGRAATEEQLKAVAESATTLINDAGLEFLGNNSSTTRLVKLGSRLTIKGADVPATGDFSEKNLTVVASNNATEDAPTLTVKMSKKPQFDEVIIGDSNSPDALLLKDGLGFNVDGTMKTFVSAAGLNANGKPIKGVGDAVDPTDAVNKRQFDALGAAKISVQAFDKDGKMKPGNSYDFSLKDGGTIGLMGDGNLNVSVDTNKKLLSLKLADVLTIGSGKPVTINGTDGSVKVGTTTLDGSQVTGLTNTAWNGTATTGRAATEDQLQAAVTDLSQNLTAKGRGFKGNIGEKTFDLGAMVSITGTGVGDADQFDGRNLMTIVNSNGISLQMRTKPVFNGLIVQQAEGAAGAGTRIDLSEGGISVGGTTFVSAAGLSGGGKKITDVADGAIGNGSHDAVTGNQLTDSMESVRVLVGGNATMTDGKLTSTNIGGTGQDTISDAIAAVKDSVTQVSTNAVQYDTAENSKVTLKGKEGTTLANVKAGAVSEHSMEAVNGSQLYATNQQVAANKDAIAANKTAIQNLQGEVQSQIGKPMTFKANEGKNIDRKLGEILEVYGLAKTEGTYSSANVKTVATDRGLEIQLADAPKFSGAVQAERFVSNDGKASFGGDGLTVGDGKNSKVTVDKDGLKISGGPSVTRDGIDAGGKRVSNLGKGVDENDAATVGQVRDEINKVTGGTGQSLGRIARRVDELDSRVDNVGAMAAAFAAVPPMAYDETHRTSLGIGYGYYSGKSAVALGLSHYINRDVMVRGGMAISGDEKSFQLGASFRLGSSPTVTRSDGRTVRISTTEMAALRKVNDLEDTVKHQDETINQQNETIKAQNEMMKQMMKRLDALEAGKRK